MQFRPLSSDMLTSCQECGCFESCSFCSRLNSIKQRLYLNWMFSSSDVVLSRLIMFVFSGWALRRVCLDLYYHVNEVWLVTVIIAVYVSQSLVSAYNLLTGASCDKWRFMSIYSMKRVQAWLVAYNSIFRYLFHHDRYTFLSFLIWLPYFTRIAS